MAIFIGMFIGHVEDQDEKIGWYSSSRWFLGQSYRDILKILDLFNNAVIEDNYIAQTVARALLTPLACAVDVASNGVEALVLCTKNHYDLIFMDIGLGDGMDGYEVTHHIRNGSTEIKKALSPF
jgi:hypothetical protein